MAVVGVGGLVEDQLGGAGAELLARLADRAERYGGGGREVDVVVADDRDVAWDVAAVADRLLEQAEGEQVDIDDPRLLPPGDMPDRAAMRALVRRTHDVRRFEPDLGLDGDAAEARLIAGRQA
jgi:hypothetical protein